MKIDVRTNGIHSMAKALEAFKAFHEDNKNVFALKDAIIRSHHALETLFKDILFNENPVLLLAENCKIKEVVDSYEKQVRGDVPTILDETVTTNLEGTIDRLRRFRLIKMHEREYTSFKRSITDLCLFRNKLQHLGISADPDVIGRVLGIVLPRSIEILNDFSGTPSIIDSLKSIYAESDSVIELLRTTYDSLIQEAVAFFDKKEFAERELAIKIRDHGEVGAPPYFAELDVNGFLNYSYNIARMDTWIWARSGKEEPYEAKVNISQPKFTKGAIPDMGIAEGTLELNARIFLENATGTIILPEAGEKIGVLRGIRIVMKSSLNYKADALMNDWHYDVRKIVEADGLLTLNIEAVPRGYAREESQIIGEYKAQLTHENAPFRLHSFVEPNGTLSKNYLLDWDINTKEKLKFK